nr:hypothetical protein BaRGS_019314 [Batillaria attramentaria]
MAQGTTSVDIEEETAPSVYAFISLAFFSLLTNYAGVVTWAWIAARQGAQIQTMFFRAVFGQVIAWFETNDADDIVQRFYDDTQTLMDSMQRVPIFTQWAVTWYTDQLRVIVRQSKRKALVLGIASSFSWAVMFAAYALAFGYGLYLAHTERCQPGHIFSVFVCVMSGSMAFGYALPCLTTFTASKPAATRVFKFISAPLTPDTTGDTEDTGVKPSSFVANIVLMGVYCRHAAKRREHITVDGRNISDLNLQWLRRHIGVITGDPVVLQATITDNIRLAHNHAPDHQIEAAAKEAGAHKFIKRLPEGYDTVLAKDGTPLGPNQLEKLAIARALLTRPELLLVDNVSSLKHSSRQIIQKILKVRAVRL